MTDPLRERLAEVEARIADAATRAGRTAAEVAIVAVTKGVPAPMVQRALDVGIRRVGENRAQELLVKAVEVRPDEWHFVGTIQRNKIARLASLVRVWHSVDRVDVGEAIARHAPGAAVYVQVNVGDEPQKGGCLPANAADLVARLRGLELSVEGLMAVPPLGADPRPHFARLRDLATGARVAGLSMGMSDDYAIAVEEGATVVRVGSALFGARPR